MRIIGDREQLLAAFQTAALVVPSRSPKPILQYVKFEVGDQGTTMTATDMEVGIRIEVYGVEVQVAGATLLPVQRFGPILRECTDEKLSIEVDSQGTTVRGERTEFKLPMSNPDEFPEVAVFDEQTYQEVPAKLLRELIRRTLFATDNESSRFALGGVLLEMEETQITAVGTDGRRLARMHGPSVSHGDQHLADQMTIVPTRSMTLIERAISDSDAEIMVAARGNDILFKSPRATIYSRLVEGRFPKWRDVFPQRTETIRIDMTVGPLLAHLRQASIVASEESRGIDFTFGEGTLVLTGLTAEVGESRVEMPIPYDGQPVTVTLDHRYVTDFLRVLDPETTFHLEIEDADSAAVFSTDDGYGYVVMPLAKDR